MVTVVEGCTPRTKALLAYGIYDWRSRSASKGGVFLRPFFDASKSTARQESRNIRVRGCLIERADMVKFNSIRINLRETGRQHVPKGSND